MATAPKSVLINGRLERTFRREITMMISLMFSSLLMRFECVRVRRPGTLHAVYA
jgi:hypothetical protein